MNYFSFKRPTVSLFVVFCGVHKISDTGRERNKMGLTLRLRGVGYCMGRYEARIWLNLAKVRYTIGPHLYFRLILFRRMCLVKLALNRDFLQKGLI